MTASNTDALSIAQAIELLEAPLAEIRKEMPGYSEFFMIVPDSGDSDLLSEFIDGVNLDFGSEVLQRTELVALDAHGYREWFAMLKGAVPFAVIWAGIRRYCGASRCSIKVKAGEDEIDVGAATQEEAERLFHCAARFIIYRLGAPPSEEKQESEQDVHGNPH
jgi:hypothetical protein